MLEPHCTAVNLDEFTSDNMNLVLDTMYFQHVSDREICVDENLLMLVDFLQFERMSTMLLDAIRWQVDQSTFVDWYSVALRSGMDRLQTLLLNYACANFERLNTSCDESTRDILSNDVSEKLAQNEKDEKKVVILFPLFQRDKMRNDVDGGFIVDVSARNKTIRRSDQSLFSAAVLLNTTHHLKSFEILKFFTFCRQLFVAYTYTTDGAESKIVEISKYNQCKKAYEEVTFIDPHAYMSCEKFGIAYNEFIAFQCDFGYWVENVLVDIVADRLVLLVKFSSLKSNLLVYMYEMTKEHRFSIEKYLAVQVQVDERTKCMLTHSNRLGSLLVLNLHQVFSLDVEAEVESYPLVPLPITPPPLTLLNVDDTECRKTWFTVSWGGDVFVFATFQRDHLTLLQLSHNDEFINDDSADGKLSWHVVFEGTVCGYLRNAVVCNQLVFLVTSVSSKNHENRDDGNNEGGECFTFDIGKKKLIPFGVELPVGNNLFKASVIPHHVLL